MLAVAAAVAVVLIVGLGIGLGVGLLTRGGPASRSPGGSSETSAAAARALYNQTLAATRGSAGVHYVSVSTGASVTQKTVGDATQDGGGQLITLNSTYGDEAFTLRLVSGTVYFQGNVPAVEDQLGVPASSAAGVQGKWVSVTSSDGPYSVLQPGITVAEQANELAMVPKSTSQVTAADGTRATRISGTITSPQGNSGTGYLDVAAGTHLPISQASTCECRRDHGDQHRHVQPVGAQPCRRQPRRHPSPGRRSARRHRPAATAAAAAVVRAPRQLQPYSPAIVVYRRRVAPRDGVWKGGDGRLSERGLPCKPSGPRDGLKAVAASEKGIYF